MYEELNSEAIQVRMDIEEAEVRMAMRGRNIANYEMNDPLLHSVIMALNSII